MTAEILLLSLALRKDLKGERLEDECTRLPRRPQRVATMYTTLTEGYWPAVSRSSKSKMAALVWRLKTKVQKSILFFELLELHDHCHAMEQNLTNQRENIAQGNPKFLIRQGDSVIWTRLTTLYLDTVQISEIVAAAQYSKHIYMYLNRTRKRVKRVRTFPHVTVQKTFSV